MIDDKTIERPAADASDGEEEGETTPESCPQDSFPPALAGRGLDRGGPGDYLIESGGRTPRVVFPFCGRARQVLTRLRLAFARGIGASALCVHAASLRAAALVELQPSFENPEGGWSDASLLR